MGGAGNGASQGAALPDAVDDPRWESIPTYQLVDARTGRRLQMPTGVQVLRSDIEIAVRFVCAARNIRATMSRFKDKVWTEGAVEVYLRPPGDPRLYEFHVSPIGTARDLVVHDPGTPEQIFDDHWTCTGLRISEYSPR